MVLTTFSFDVNAQSKRTGHVDFYLIHFAGKGAMGRDLVAYALLHLTDRSSTRTKSLTRCTSSPLYEAKGRELQNLTRPLHYESSRPH
jgi:hypothetical protein